MQMHNEMSLTLHRFQARFSLESGEAFSLIVSLVSLLGSSSFIVFSEYYLFSLNNVFFWAVSDCNFGQPWS